MDLDKLNTGEKLAGVAGIALFLIMIVFNWFGAEVPGVVDIPGFAEPELDQGANAWQSFGLIDIVLFITAVAAIALPVITLIQARVDLPVAMSAIVALLGIIAAALILFRIIVPPDFGGSGFGADLDTTRKIGVFLGLLSAIGIAAGGWLAMQEEGTSFGAARDQARDRMSGGDSGGGGPTPSGGPSGPSAGETPPPPPASGGASEAPPPPPPPRQGA